MVEPKCREATSEDVYKYRFVTVRSEQVRNGIDIALESADNVERLRFFGEPGRGNASHDTYWERQSFLFEDIARVKNDIGVACGDWNCAQDDDDKEDEEDLAAYLLSNLKVMQKKDAVSSTAAAPSRCAAADGSGKRPEKQRRVEVCV